MSIENQTDNMSLTSNYLETIPKEDRFFIDTINGRLDNIVASDVDIHVKDTYGRTGLQCAAVSGNLDIVKHLVSKGINIHDGSLRIAASKYHTDIVMYLHEQGADIESVNTCNESALFSSLINIEPYKDNGFKQAECAVYLMRQGADLKLTNQHKVSVEKLLKANNAIDNICAYLIETDANLDECFMSVESILTTAICHNNTDVLKKLISAGIDVNTNNETTPLMLAVAKKSFDSAELLVNASADIHRKNKKGLTALDILRGTKGVPVKLVELIESRDYTDIST